MQPFLRACWLSSSGDGGEAGQQFDPKPLRAYVTGIGQSAGADSTGAYRLVEGGAEQKSIIHNMERMGRAMEVGDAYPVAPNCLVVTELDSLDAAADLEARLGDHVRDLRSRFGPEALRTVATGVYRDIAFIAGVEEAPAAGFGPVMQFGVFNMRSEEDEWEMTEWYRLRRLPGFARLPGSIRARRLVSACGGPAKFAIFYEFTSLEERIEHFEPMNARDHQLAAGDHAGGSGPQLIADRTVHPPMSPCIGAAISMR